MSHFPLSKSRSSASSTGTSQWRYDAGDGQPLVIRVEPDLDGPRTTETLRPYDIFTAAEEKFGDDGIVYLRLGDGRGWVFDRKPGVGLMCQRIAHQEAAYWRYDAGDGQCLVVREAPELDGPRTDVTLQPGEVFCVAMEKEGRDGVTFLQLADGRGWAFDCKPGVGVMCERHCKKQDVEAAKPSPYWRYIANDGKPIFLRAGPDIDAARLEETLDPGDFFCVSEERVGSHGVLYLQLADRSGWLFDSKPGVGVMCERHEAPVILHIYDVPSHPTAQRINGVFRALGTGAFHAAVEVFGVEWSYGGNMEGEGGTGVFACTPKGCEGHAYRESLHMGHVPMHEDEARALIGMMSKDWLAKDYDMLRRNCCHWSDTLCQALEVGPIPGWVRNLSGVARVLDDGRRGFADAAREVVGPVVAPLVARGKIARGGSPSDAFQFGDFTRGVVVAAAAQATDLMDGKAMREVTDRFRKTMECSE